MGTATPSSPSQGLFLLNRSSYIYHPFWSKPENNLMRDNLFKSFSLAESKFPNCALIVAGDFNRLDVKSIQRHFRLKQIVKMPTRKNAILDLVLTNLHEFYDTPQSFPPFGLSDHNTVTADARARDTNDDTSVKVVLKRDKRAGRKAELGRYLNSMDWSCLFANAENCQDMVNVFQKVIQTGLDCLMAMKTVRVNTSDVPWMTQHLKGLILKRQKAFHTHGAESAQYKFFRNIVNRERKKCKGNFYKTKIAHAKDDIPKLWWKEVKRLLSTKSHSGDLKHQIHIEGVEDLSDQDLANMINKALLEPLEEYRLTQPLVKVPIEIDTPDLHEISELRILRLLSKLNPSKASGPDEVPNWHLKEFANFIAFPVRKIINASLREQCFPHIRKLADVTPLTKRKPVEDLKKDLRPI